MAGRARWEEAAGTRQKAAGLWGVFHQDGPWTNHHSGGELKAEGPRTNVLPR